MNKKQAADIIRAVLNERKMSNQGNYPTKPPRKLKSIDETEIDLSYDGETQSSDNEYDDDYLANSQSETISFIEFAIINGYFHDVYRGKEKDIQVLNYGTVDSTSKMSFGGVFDITSPFWFDTRFAKDENSFIVQTQIFVHRGELITSLNVTCKKGITGNEFDEIFKTIKSLSFNHSEYKGKCIKVKLREGHFKGIDIIDIEESANELILNDVQKRYIKHFISRVARGGNARYLLNGEPGTGKTESIREIARKLIPDVTFVIPEFTSSDDLNSIMEACEIFEQGVIVMDDIDLYLGSRDNGSYTRLLGQFLSFFDGVKKRNISLLASTNDKGLVDKAAERPGRFNFTIDYTFLNDEQIVQVCNIHLDKKWRIDAVYEALKGNVGGKKAKITGAFIANLADNIREMSEDEDEWTVEDTVSLIKESYKGFYSSQIEKEASGMGFVTK